MTNLTNSWLSDFIGKNMWSIIVMVAAVIVVVSNYKSETEHGLKSHQASLEDIDGKLDEIGTNVKVNRNTLGETLGVVNDLCDESEKCMARNPKIALPE